MWSYRLVAPYTFERVDIPEKTPESLGDRQVLLRFLAAGVCGSDLPGFRGSKGRLAGDTGEVAAVRALPALPVAGDATLHARLHGIQLCERRSGLGLRKHRRRRRKDSQEQDALNRS